MTHPRPSLAVPMPSEPPTSAAHTEEIDRELREVLAHRMASYASVADSAHAILAALAMLLVSRWVPGTVIAIAFGAVVLAVVIRRVLRARADRTNDPDKIFLAARIGSAVMGLTWGLAVVTVSRHIPGEVLAWLAVILAGLVSAASSNMLPDPASFFIMEGSLLGFLLVAIFISNETTIPFQAAGLITLYGIVMALFFRRSRINLMAQLRVAKKLEVTERAAATSRKQAERLAGIVEATSDHVGMAGVDKRLRYLNRAGRQMLGIPASESAANVSVTDFTTPAFHQRMDAEIVPRLMQEGSWRGETVMIHRDGHEVPVSLVTLAHRDADGKIETISAIARDMTEQVKAQEELRIARDAAQQASAAKSAFLANTSHEIRTPLNGILGMVELMRDTELTPSQRHSLELIATSGDTLLNTINDLLDLSKIEAGQLTLEDVIFDAPQVALDATRLFASRAAEKGIELMTDVDPAVPRYVLGDPHRFRQVISNLVSNAIKFTKQGSVIVELSRTTGRHPRLVVIVQDTGIGIAAEHFGRIFEPFLQVESSTTRHFGGTGLGLSIARRLVRLMGGGDVRVSSTVGAGSEFEFDLPLREAHQPAATARPAPVELQGVRVLVVDDHPVNRRVLAGSFTAAGCDVAVCESATDALAAARKAASAGASFALVASDVQMPGRDGFQLVEDLRADKSLADTAVLLLSSATRPGDQQRCTALGVAAYLQKPVSRSELLDAARAALRRGSKAAPDGKPRISPTERHLRILLAEDNPINQEVAAAMLRKRGHVVEIVGSGAEAVSAFSDHGDFDAVLMDVQMPEMDGIEATRRIRALPNGRGDVPIIALTASVSSDERERCSAAGMDAFLGKPFKPDELFDAVENARPRARRAGRGAVSNGAESSSAPVDVASFRQMLAAANISAEAGDTMLRLFLRDAPKRVAALRDAIDARDATALGKAAHGLRSSAGTIGAAELTQLLGSAESAAGAGDLETASRDARGAIHACEEACAYLEGLLMAESES